jgi:UDP-N-acetylmuramyl pentapeptide synthase/glycosyltransferase involved in cell wall biosynthesis
VSDTRPLLACLLPVRNGADDLPGYLECVATVCDLVIALDDGSTDGTPELLRASPLVARVLENPPRMTYSGWDDAANRRRLLAAADEFAPRWVLWLDADERIDPGDAAALRTFLETDALPGFAFGLRHFRMWGDHYDPDYTWIYRLFAHRPGQILPDQRLHFDPVPVDLQVHAWVETTIRIRHLGAATEKRRQARVRKYREADPDGEWQSDFGGLFAKPEGGLPRWEPRPAGLPVLVPGVVAADRVPLGAPRAVRGDGARTQKLVCLLPARNCAHDLPAYFESVARFADAIVALDDGSTDDTRALLEREPLVKVLLTNPRRESYRGWDDAGNRNRLLEAAGALNPDWTLSLDADERLDASDAAALLNFVEHDALPGYAYGMKVYSMSGDPDHYDAGSGVRQPLRVYRLFAYEPGQRLAGRRLHLVPVPESIPRSRWLETTLRIQHVGNLTEERRRLRFSKYEEADPNREFQSAYGHLLAPPARVLPWRPRDPNLSVLADMADAAALLDELDLDGPVISAIVISRDDEDRIERAVGALVAQDCPEPFEIIVVTSGTDRTADIVRSRFPQVTLVELPRPALPGEARNAGLSVARGDYVTFPGSHIELPQGSLAARVRAHESGYPMVTGSTLNGTKTWAGWASYFIDHAAVLPGRPADRHRTPPGHCSYMRELLTAVGGFPEDMRAGEDTVVNMELTGRGYPTWRAQDVTMIHHSPCATPGVLLRHHFKRGRAHGRIILDQWAPGLPPAGELRYFLAEYLPGRVRQITAAVRSWGSRRERARYTLVFPLVVAGAAASWVGTWYELLTAGRARRDEVAAAVGFAGVEPPTVSHAAGPAEPRRPEERAHRGPVLEALYPHAPRHRLVAQVPPSTRSRLRRAVTAAVTHAHLVRRPGVAIVGITGSTGKTTTKDLLGEMLARFGPTLRTRHNDNGVYGVPATLLAIRPSDRFAVLELGILDGPGEMRWMARLFRPRVAVLTGIGQDHLEAYGSREAIIREKRALLARLGRHGTAVVNADDALARGATAGLPCRVITAGWAQDADVRIVDARLVWPHGLDLELDCGGRRVRGRVGVHSRELAHIPALAVAAAGACGVPPEGALDAAGAFTPRLGRLCPVPGPDGSMFLVDDFKSRLPNALLAVRALREVPATRRIAVVGELQEGALDGAGYLPIADELCATADLLVAVGGGADPLRAALDGRAPVVMSVEDANGAAEVLEGTLRDGDVVLLHGADYQDLELVTEILNGVPRGVPRPAHRTGRRALEVNAYIEPHRVDRALETAAHHLTYLSVLSHEVRPDGRLEPLRSAQVSVARGTGDPARLLVLTNREGDRFSRQLAAEILGSAPAQDRLVANVARVAAEHGYRGVNVDFENLGGDQRDAYTGLIERFAATLRPQGLWLSSTLAPRVPSAQAASEFAAYNYGAHGALTDFVVVTTYERGAANGPPIPIDPLGAPHPAVPLDGMRDVINDALSEIPAEKVLMGMHMRVAPPRSIDAELALADELGVRGVSYSRLPPEGAGDWSLLGRRFQLRKRSSSLPHAYSPTSPAARTHA